MDAEKIKKAAERQVEQDLFDEAVAKEVEKLKRKKSFWEIVFPFTITIKRR